MLNVDDARFFLRDFQLEPFFEPLRDSNFCLFSRSFCPAKDTEVVGVAYDVHFLQIGVAHSPVSVTFNFSFLRV